MKARFSDKLIDARALISFKLDSIVRQMSEKQKYSCYINNILVHRQRFH